MQDKQPSQTATTPTKINDHGLCVLCKTAAPSKGALVTCKPCRERVRAEAATQEKARGSWLSTPLRTSWCRCNHIPCVCP